MYVRLARFEGGDPAVIDQEIEGMREQIRKQKAGQGGEDPSGQMSREQMQDLERMIKRVLLFVDREQGTTAMAVFTETEEDARTVDRMFDQMSPPDDGGGRRLSADVYEVAIDEQMS